MPAPCSRGTSFIPAAFLLIVDELNQVAQSAPGCGLFRILQKLITQSNIPVAAQRRPQIIEKNTEDILGRHSTVLALHIGQKTQLRRALLRIARGPRIIMKLLVDSPGDSRRRNAAMWRSNNNSPVAA